MSDYSPQIANLNVVQYLEFEVFSQLGIWFCVTMYILPVCHGRYIDNDLKEYNNSLLSLSRLPPPNLFPPFSIRLALNSLSDPFYYLYYKPTCLRNIEASYIPPTYTQCLYFVPTPTPVLLFFGRVTSIVVILELPIHFCRYKRARKKARRGRIKQWTYKHASLRCSA